MYRIHLDMSNVYICILQISLQISIAYQLPFKTMMGLCFSVTVHDIQYVVHLLLGQIEVLNCYAYQHFSKGVPAYHETEVKICALNCFLLCALFRKSIGGYICPRPSTASLMNPDSWLPSTCSLSYGDAAS